MQGFAKALFVFSICVAIGSTTIQASASALPGNHLYPIKRAWENTRLVLASHPAHRRALADRFENERLHEINLLLADGKEEWIEFAGLYLEIDGLTYVSGIPIRILEVTVLPNELLANNQPVIVKGRTSVDTCVDAAQISLRTTGRSYFPHPKLESNEHTDHRGSSRIDTRLFEKTDHNTLDSQKRENQDDGRIHKPSD